MLENMKNRRTIRKYTTQDIPDALLNELLEVAARASNTGNKAGTLKKAKFCLFGCNFREVRV